MRTNRDLHEFVEALPRTDRGLEDYLRALAGAVGPHRGADGLALDVFAALLREALTRAPATGPDGELNAFEALLWQQIGELPRRKFSRRHWDYAAVRGSESRWYNASVAGFLERGVEGAFGGWDAVGEDLEDLGFLTWDQLRDFLVQGQWYE